jgi:PAS domain S-box-containing protein
MKKAPKDQPRPLTRKSVPEAPSPDLHEHQHARSTRRAGMDHFRLLSDNALAGNYIVQDGRLTYVNPALKEIFGYEPIEMICTSPLDMLQSEDLELVKKNIQRQISGEEKTIRYEFNGKCKDGQTSYVRVLGMGLDLDGRLDLVW